MHATNQSAFSHRKFSFSSEREAAVTARRETGTGTGMSTSTWRGLLFALLKPVAACRGRM